MGSPSQWMSVSGATMQKGEGSVSITLNSTARTIGGFSHDDLIEPIAVAVNNDDEVLIADNGVGSILVFESCGKLKKKIGTKGKNKGEFKELSSVCIGPAGEIIVADTRIIVFSP